MPVKALAERVLLASGGRAARWRMRDRALILAYHNVVPDELPPFGDRSLHLRRSSFAAQLDALRETHDVVPLRDVLRPWRGSRPRAAITFDDAYAGAVTIGVGEVVARGLPATVFVTPAFVGGASFWWDAIADADGLDPALRAQALTEHRGMDRPVRAWVVNRGLGGVREVPAVARVASLSEIVECARRPGITIGSHTWSHPNLARLETDELATELSRPIAWLREHVAEPLPWLTYPYGAFDADVAAAAAATGYEAACAIDGGWTSAPPADRYAIPRLNVPAGLSLAGFQLRTSGLLTLHKFARSRAPSA